MGLLVSKLADTQLTSHFDFTETAAAVRRSSQEEHRDNILLRPKTKEENSSVFKNGNRTGLVNGDDPEASTRASPQDNQVQSIASTKTAVPNRNLGHASHLSSSAVVPDGSSDLDELVAAFLKYQSQSLSSLMPKRDTLSRLVPKRAKIQPQK